jgi:hypothetical protein
MSNTRITAAKPCIWSPNSHRTLLELRVAMLQLSDMIMWQTSDLVNQLNPIILSAVKDLGVRNPELERRALRNSHIIANFWPSRINIWKAQRDRWYHWHVLSKSLSILSSGLRYDIVEWVSSDGIHSFRVCLLHSSLYNTTKPYAFSHDIALRFKVTHVALIALPLKIVPHFYRSRALSLIRRSSILISSILKTTYSLSSIFNSKPKLSLSGYSKNGFLVNPSSSPFSSFAFSS